MEIQIEPRSTELRKRVRCSITGIEISRTFVEIARRNAELSGVELNVVQGNACAMPFGDDSFDLVYCTSSFKNFDQPQRALEEMRRVLKPGGKVWLSDLRRDVTDEGIRTLVDRAMGARGLTGLMMRSTFQRFLRPRAYTSGQFSEMAGRANLNTVDIRNNQMDFEALLEK